MQYKFEKKIVLSHFYYNVLLTKVNISFEICQKIFCDVCAFLLCLKKVNIIYLFFASNFYLFVIEAAVAGSHNDSSSCSSGPESPNVQGGGENNSGRTQYVSATCVVVTHYSGDVASVVDEHFTRALNFNEKNSKGKN